MDQITANSYLLQVQSLTKSFERIAVALERIADSQQPPKRSGRYVEPSDRPTASELAQHERSL